MGFLGVLVFGFLVVVFFFAIKPWLNCVKNTNMKRDKGYIGMLDLHGFCKKNQEVLSAAQTTNALYIYNGLRRF
jgi:hypothetical protein